MTPCSTSSTWKTMTRSGAIVVVFGLGLASSGISYAADGSASTVRAVIGGDGKVTSISRLGGDSATKPAASDLPITMAISKAGDTVSYAVSNTTGKSESVTVTSASGATSSVQQEVQTPYVAMLHVHLPASLTDVAASGASVVTNSDGSHDLTWSMVLFAPIGSPSQTVAYTAKGSGSPVATLESQAVNPNGTPGLSATGATANATLAGNGTLGALASGANAGLDQLAAGVGKIIAGLEKLAAGANALHTGLGAGADGTNQLAAGLHKAKTGSGQLSSGLGQISAGTGQLAPGAAALKVGTGKLLAGLDLAAAGSDKLVNGSQDLATGAGLTAAGAKALSDGLQLISGGLGQLGASAGLPAAKAGALALQAGVQQILAGLGSPTTAGTILGGLAGLDAGLTGVKGGLDQLADPAKGLPAAKAGVDGLSSAVNNLIFPGVVKVRDGLASAAANGGGIDLLNSVVAGVAAKTGCALTGPTATPSPLTKSCQDLNYLYYAINHTSTGTSDPGGLKQQTQAGADGLTLIAGGLKSGSSNPASYGVSEGLGAISAGLSAAITGVNALDAGVGLKTDGAKSIRGGLALVNGGVLAVTAGLHSGDASKPGIDEGLSALINGLTAAIDGVTQLSTGAGAAATGSIALAAGTRAVADGAGQLSELGAVPISDGLHQLAAGQALADAGAGKLAAGAGLLNAGALKAFIGSKALDAGLGKISAGEDKLAAGLPAAVTGSGQIADGAGQLLAGNKAVGKGLSDVKGKATGILASQLTTGTQNAQTQLAVLDATSARLNAAGVATTTYVLSQASDGSIQAVKAAGSGNHLGRNVALAAGGALLLLGGLGAGFVSGRRRSGV